VIPHHWHIKSTVIHVTDEAGRETRTLLTTVSAPVHEVHRDGTKEKFTWYFCPAAENDPVPWIRGVYSIN
jgi:hypothetical protein